MTLLVANVVDATSRVDFLIVIVGVILGLSIGRFVTFLGDLVLHRAHVKVSLTHLCYLVTLFLYQVYYWWSVWDFRSIAEINFLSYLRLMLVPIFLYGGTAVLAPQLPDNGKFSLEDHFHQHARAFYLILAALIITGLSQGYHLWDQRGLKIWLRVAALAVPVLGFAFNHRGLNRVLAIGLLTVGLAFITVMVSDGALPDEVRERLPEWVF